MPIRPVNTQASSRSVPSLKTLALAIGSLAACAPLPRGLGPIPARNQHPVQLTVLHLDPVPAATLPAGEASVRLDTAYSSLWLGGRANGNSFTMDGENLRAALDLRVGLAAGLELELGIPVGYASGGGLDSFVTGWHDFWGLPDQGRSDFPTDEFVVRAERGTATVYEQEANRLQVMDLPIGLRQELFASGPAHVAARVAVELPTGDDDAGFGNGELDVAVGAIADLRWEDFGVYAHAHHTFAGTPGRAKAAGVEFRDVTALGLGVDYRVFASVTLHVQAEWETSTLRALGFDRVADPHLLLWSGLRAALGPKTFLELAIGEDLQAYISPDFSIWAAVGTTFGGS